jgi:hypothetical protein
MFLFFSFLYDKIKEYYKMKVIFYIIIFGILLVILLYSLFLYNKNSNKNSNNKIEEKFIVPNKPVITSVNFIDGLLSIGWNKPWTPPGAHVFCPWHCRCHKTDGRLHGATKPHQNASWGCTHPTSF